MELSRSGQENGVVKSRLGINVRRKNRASERLRDEGIGGYERRDGGRKVDGTEGNR